MAGADADIAARAARLIQDAKAGQALDLLGKAFAAQPGRADLLALMAEAHSALSQPAAAAACRRCAVALDPTPERRADLALALHDCGRLDLARTEADLALAMTGGAAFGARLALALIALTEARFAEAEAALRALVAEHPDRAPLWVHLGYALWATGNGDGAQASLMRARHLAPGLDVAAGRLALLHLARGKLAEGWELYRRRRVPGRALAPTRRLPASLAGKRVLVEGEQGLGDELFFLRFVARLAARGAKVTYRAGPKLAPLLRGLPGLARVIGPGETAKVDMVCWAGDLPWLLDETGPLPPVTLSADPARVARLSAQLAGFSKRRAIGLTWRAGTQAVGHLSKALDAAGLAGLLAGIDADFVVLQRQPGPGEVAAVAAALGRPVLDWSGLNDDLADMTAALSLLDDQIAVSNTNIHLAASLGKPARVLLPHPPEFRWMDKGGESAWFPGMRLYRQPPGGNWRAALDALVGGLGGGSGPAARALETAARMRDAKRWPECEAACRSILAEAPDHLGALQLLAVALLSSRRPAEAVDPLARLDRHTPTSETARFLGSALKAAGRPAEAVAPLRRALVDGPNRAQVHELLASALMEAGQYDDALAEARAARCGRVEGSTLHLLGRSDEAVPILRQAAATGRDVDKVLNSLGQALYALGEYEEAERAWRDCLARNPDNANAHGSFALLLLAQGRFAEGWDHYRFRHTALGRPGLPTRRLPARLDGADVLVMGEQGLGDELFLLRFVARVAARGARIRYAAGPKLAPLVAGLPFLAGIETPAPGLRADVVLWAGDLPWLLDEPGPLPPVALVPDPALVERLRAQLAAFGPPPYVGATWRAGIVGFNKLSKDVPADRLAAALAPVDARIVVLQRAPAAGEVAAFAAALGRDVLDWSDLNDDLAAMLAGLSLLDDQAAVSNTNIHLAASLGKPARVLVAAAAEFRWMTEGDATPWFPSMTSYRQARDRDWEPALDRLSQDLRRP